MLTGLGDDVVHFNFGKAELLPPTFQQMRMKFWERLSETLVGVWEEWYTTIEEQRPELLQNKQQCPKLNGK